MEEEGRDEVLVMKIGEEQRWDKELSVSFDAFRASLQRGGGS